MQIRWVFILLRLKTSTNYEITKGSKPKKDIGIEAQNRLSNIAYNTANRAYKRKNNGRNIDREYIDSLVDLFLHGDESPTGKMNKQYVNQALVNDIKNRNKAKQNEKSGLITTIDNK